jgi:hypothetical protein
MIHTSIANVKPKIQNKKYVTSEFIGLTKYYIFQDLFNISREHKNNFGELVICLDKSSDGYWRKSIYPGYKSGRKKAREESNINFGEVFKEIDGLIYQIRNNLPWRVVEVNTAEADDIMLVLSREYNKYEKILIHSPDKDMIQAQRDTENVFQYSSLTKKWIVPENKHDHMDHWILEHVILGDGADDIPKVIDGTEFSDRFIEYLESKKVNFRTPFEFKNSGMPIDEKRTILEEFNFYKTNRDGESTGVKDIYKDIKFGPVSLQKKIKEFGSLENWLDSNPLYREHYNRNVSLIMEEGIPSNIWNEIILEYKESNSSYNEKEFIQYLNENSLKSIIMDLSSIFKIDRELTSEDFGW